MGKEDIVKQYNIGYFCHSFSGFTVNLVSLCKTPADLFFKENDEELEGKVHEVAWVESVPESEEEQSDELRQLLTAKELQSLEHVSATTQHHRRQWYTHSCRRLNLRCPPDYSYKLFILPPNKYFSDNA